ncbi:polysaccharide biosynthesis/export family protein [Candidatus Omnitrophota bacterium]
MKDKIRIISIYYFVVALLLALPKAGIGADDYAPLAQDYIERAQARLQEREGGQRQAVISRAPAEPQPAAVTDQEIEIASQIPNLVPYYLVVGDQFAVAVWQHPDLSQAVIVAPDGKISYPLIGREQAAGLTIGQLERKIASRLSTYIRYPDVSITLTEVTGDKIIMLGEVASPGVYTFNPPFNLIEAVAAAGDFTDDARQDCVIVVRGNFTEKPQVKRINMSRIISKGTSKSDIILQSSDVVYVPKSYIARLDRFLMDISPTISQITSMMGIRDYRNVHTLSTMGDNRTYLISD